MEGLADVGEVGELVGDGGVDVVVVGEGMVEVVGAGRGNGVVDAEVC